MATMSKTSSFSRTMTSSTPAKEFKSGLIPKGLRFYSGQLSPQTLIPLNIFGFISRKGLETIKSQQEKKKSFGRGLRWNEKRFLKKSVKN